MSMPFDGAWTLKNWEVSWLLRPGISNWKAAELTDHLLSTFLIGLTRMADVVTSVNVIVQEYLCLGTVTIFKRSMESVSPMTTNYAQRP